MKILIVLVCLFLFVPSMCLAREEVLILQESSVGTICLEGFLFAYVKNGSKGGAFIIQVMRKHPRKQLIIPVECGNKGGRK